MFRRRYHSAEFRRIAVTVCQPKLTRNLPHALHSRLMSNWMFLYHKHCHKVVNICSAEILEEEAILPLENTIEVSATTNGLLEEADKGERRNISTREVVDATTIPTQPLTSALSHESEEIARK